MKEPLVYPKIIELPKMTIPLGGAIKEAGALPAIRGWVARHRNGELCLFHNKPEYKLHIGWVDEHQHWWVIDPHLLPDITMKNSPKEVELAIRPL